MLFLGKLLDRSVMEVSNTLRVAVTQTRIDDYVKGAEAFFPNMEKWQLVSMVILHFDIPDAEAKRMVEFSFGVKEK